MTSVPWQESTPTKCIEKSYQTESESLELKNEILSIPSLIMEVKSISSKLQETHVVGGGEKLMTGFVDRSNF